MKALFLTLIICVTGVCTAGTSKLGDSERISSSDFERRINTIHAKVVDLTNIFALHHVKEFNDVYTAPSGFEGLVLDYLSRPNMFDNKLIAVCLMTDLPFDRYVGLLSSYYALYIRKKIDEHLLYRCIFNEFDTKYRLAKEYNNLRIRKFLDQMLHSNSLSKNFKTNIKETLNGKWYADIKKVHI